jgi:hypothetical protein
VNIMKQTELDIMRIEMEASRAGRKIAALEGQTLAILRYLGLEMEEREPYAVVKKEEKHG